VKNFRHATPPSLEAAIALLREPGAKAIAGGTDLLTELKARIQTPELLVNMKGLSELRGIREDEKFVRIGALTTLSELESHPLIRERFPSLAQAADSAATPQLRNVGTVGGNLCQQVRCWYYRHPYVRCWLKGGEECYAEEGLNHRHAIFGTTPCIAVHPSDLAPALIALDAEVRVVGPEVKGELPLDELYRLPDETRRERTVLGPADLIVEILVPKPAEGSYSVYLKAMERATWSFALVSVAIRLDLEGDRVKEARLVLGGVAGKPWRVRDAETLLQGQGLTEELAERVAEAAVAGAQPREHNAYKIPLTKVLVKRALMELTGIDE
jgi:xanthine dehydrogenase YagS FAD-binding subunit